MNWIVQAYADVFNVTLGYTDRKTTVHHSQVEPRNTTRARDETPAKRHRASS